MTGRGGGTFKGRTFVGWRTSCNNLKAGSVSPRQRWISAVAWPQLVVSREENPMENAMKNAENMGLLALKKRFLHSVSVFHVLVHFFFLVTWVTLRGGVFFSNLSPQKKNVPKHRVRRLLFFQLFRWSWCHRWAILAGEGDDGSKGWFPPSSSKWVGWGWDFPTKNATFCSGDCYKGGA